MPVFHRNPLVYTLGLLVLLALAVPGKAQMSLRTIHQERSLYRNILITEDSERRCMRFTITRRNGQNQSCQYLDDPEKLVFPYAKMTLSSLLIQPHPERILIVGLGGGTLVDAYSTLFPQTEIIISEIDESVLQMAREYFSFEETDRIKVDIGDARPYIKRALLRDEQFDLVILDAFNGDYIPEHLMTKEFLEEVKGLLPEDGMVVANTFSTSDLYDSESVTYEQVFGEIISVDKPGTGNRVIIATKAPLPGQETLAERAPAWQDTLARFGMDITDYPPLMSTEPDWDTGARPLTDQYAPVNLLND